MTSPHEAIPTDEKLLFEANLFITDEISPELEKSVIDDLRKLRIERKNAIIEVNTKGGDADSGRRIAGEIEAFPKFAGQAFIVGRTNVYSAGMSIMAAVPPRNRFLSQDTMLLIHERRMKRTIELTGPLKSSIQIVREELATLEATRDIENQGFSALVRGTQISLGMLREKAENDWYLSAYEALELGLVARVIDCEQ